MFVQQPLTLRAELTIRLFHASEESGISLFEPREVPSPDSGVMGKAVWAVDEDHLPNYLLPRDCPRVTFAASMATSEADRIRFLNGTSAKRVVALESSWYARIRSCQLFLYELPAETFESVDAGAGYYISRESVVPRAVTRLEDLIAELLKRDIEVRFLPNLWSLRNSVAASTLEFSIIRFRNAQPVNG